MRSDASFTPLDLTTAVYTTYGGPTYPTSLDLRRQTLSLAEGAIEV